LVNWRIVLGGIVVLSSKVLSCASREEMISIASSTGTFVKRLTMSKLNIRSSSSNIDSSTRLAKSDEFFTKELVWPAIGVRTLASSLDSLYVGESIVDTIGRRGVPSLWTFGSPYSRGGVEKCGVS